MSVLQPSKTTTTLVFQDPAGNPLAGGLVRLQLSEDVSLSTSRGPQVGAGRIVSATLDDTGSCTIQLWGNDTSIINVDSVGTAVTTDGQYVELPVSSVAPFSIGQSVQAAGFSSGIISINGQAGLTVYAIGTDTVTIHSHDLTNGSYSGQNGVLTVAALPTTPPTSVYFVTAYAANGEPAWSGQMTL
jgi:hypothetical protein